MMMRLSKEDEDQVDEVERAEEDKDQVGQG